MVFIKSKTVRQEIKDYTHAEIIELYESVERYRTTGDKDLKLQIMAADLYGCCDGHNLDALCLNICTALARRYIELIKPKPESEPTEIW